MNTCLRLVFFVLIWHMGTEATHAQTWQWATKGSGPHSDHVNGVAVDSQGNSYVAGTFFDSITCGNITLNNAGVWSVFLIKYDINGNLMWAKTAASDSAISVGGIQLDQTGNMYITGQYYGTAVFGTVAPDILVSAGDFDVFIARYNSSGDLVWAMTVGGSGHDNAGGISADQSGHVYLTGDFHITAFPYSGSRIFIASYDSSGNNLWTQAETTVGTSHFGNAIKTDSAGNSFITGSFFGTINFDSVVVIDAGNIESNVYIARFDANGHFTWGQKAGASSGYAAGYSIDIDAAGNACISGVYHGTINLGSYSISSTSGLGYDVFAAKCDGAGNYLWVNKSTGAGSVHNICFDNFGNVYLAGFFSQTISFGSNNLASAGNTDVFLTRLDSSGNFNWATACGGVYADKVYGLQINAGGLFLTGEFLDTVFFSPSVFLANASMINSDIFTARLSIPTGIPNEGPEEPGLFLYPNPAMATCLVSIGLPAGHDAEITLSDDTGRDVSKKVTMQSTGGKQQVAYDVSKLAAGIYFVKLAANGFYPVTRKLIIQ